MALHTGNQSNDQDEENLHLCVPEVHYTHLVACRVESSHVHVLRLLFITSVSATHQHFSTLPTTTTSVNAVIVDVLALWLAVKVDRTVWRSHKCLVESMQ